LNGKIEEASEAVRKATKIKRNNIVIEKRVVALFSFYI
jgi:hypothetical protein